MGKSKRVLFICDGNLHRSPTAERLYATTPGIKPKSAGLSDLARIRVTDELLSWAEIIFVMEKRHVRMLQRRFVAELAGKDLVCLSVSDDYQYLQPELIEVLTERLIQYLGPPVA